MASLHDLTCHRDDIPNQNPFEYPVEDAHPSLGTSGLEFTEKGIYFLPSHAVLKKECQLRL